MRIKIAPSILSADFKNLGSELKAAEMGGADWIHLDVMDGHFVPNITIGPLVAASLRDATKLPMDAHLMISEPDRYVRAFADSGVASITVHAEATPHLHRTVQAIREVGVRAGVAINPATTVEAIREILPYLDMVVIMSVNPGFGGQRFIPSSIEKIKRMRTLLDSQGLQAVDIQVDGGVVATNISEIVRAGASVVVAGSSVYNRDRSVGENLRLLRDAIGD